jgi:Txe/YoeB family toxin of toxin-antitoxin system
MNLMFTKIAQKHYAKIKNNSILLKKVAALLDIVHANPFQNPPPYEKLTGDLDGYYSRRINRQHRLVYKVVSNEVWIMAMWTHYEF